MISQHRLLIDAYGYGNCLFAFRIPAPGCFCQQNGYDYIRAAVIIPAVLHDLRFRKLHIKYRFARACRISDPKEIGDRFLLIQGSFRIVDIQPAERISCFRTRDHIARQAESGRIKGLSGRL